MTMKFAQVAVGVMVTVMPCGSTLAEEPPSGSKALSLCEGETLTAEWFGGGPPLAECGLSLALSTTQACQANTRGGLSTHRHRGRWAGSYDLELTFDEETLRIQVVPPERREG
jgi:hypothetical protein